MGASYRIAFYSFCTVTVWCSYAAINDTSALLYLALAEIAACLAITLHKVHWLSLLVIVLWLVAMVTWAAGGWYTALCDGPDAVMYVALALGFVDSVVQFKRAAMSNVHLWDKVHTMRICIYRAIMVFPVASVIYYTVNIFTLLRPPDAPSLEDSTLDTRFNRTFCDELDVSDDHKYELYDVTPFTLPCIGEVWERLRVNMLVIVQLYISFVLVVEMPYWLNRGLDAQCSQTNRKEIVGILYITQILCLFFGATMALNHIERWFVLDIVPSVLLTVSFTCASIRELITMQVRKIWVIPIVQECTDVDKSDHLKL